MLAKDSVSTRLESETGISFTEFSYMLLQSYDFYHLFQTGKRRIQFGASDQSGNLTAGRTDPSQSTGRSLRILCPSVAEQPGAKNGGKSEAGAIFLDPKLCSPYRFHQYLLNVPDADVIKLLKTFSFFSQNEIEKFETQLKEAPKSGSLRKH